MKKLHGTGASNGIAIGKLLLIERNREVQKYLTDDIERELARLDIAQKKAVDAMNEIYQQSIKKIGKKNSMIFQIHIMMIQDEDFSDAVREKIIKGHVNAEYAVWSAGEEFSERFAKMDNEDMRGRKADVIDIARRWIGCLDTNAAADKMQFSKPSIVVADDFTPSETMQMDRSKVLAIVTRKGSKTSHSAILARTMEIPAIIGMGDDLDEIKNGMFAIVDGSSGELLLSPGKSTVQNYKKLQWEHRRQNDELRKKLKSDFTGENKIEVYANIGHPADIENVLQNGADGIGLFRSEFLYMERDSLPSEEEQFQAYKLVLEKMNGKPVIIRTFDIGADKQVPYLDLPREANPAMGYRAIRICLDRRELFCTQLLALMRASVYGNLKIMFPMIISVNELKTAKSILNEIKSDLSSKNIAFSKDVPIGVMIETPAAVMLSGELAKECDFFSIGTNDLTQYTLAVDRMNENISKLYDYRHPAVLKMIEMTASSAKRAKIPVGICGESAADTSLTEFYKAIGINELSVAPSLILEVKKEIYGLSL